MAAAAAMVSAGAPASTAQTPPDDAAEVLATVAEHARAHPAMRGPIVLTRHERTHARTTREEGSIAVDATGALITIGPDADVTIRPDVIEAFDGASSPALVLVLRGETPLARYAAMLAGEDPSTLFSSRLVRRDGSRATIELVPRLAWPGLERIVARVVAEGRDRGRIERVLWLDGLGNWQRVELERVRYPARLDPSLLSPRAHPEARRVEL